MLMWRIKHIWSQNSRIKNDPRVNQDPSLHAHLAATDLCARLHTCTPDLITQIVHEYKCSIIITKITLNQKYNMYHWLFQFTCVVDIDVSILEGSRDFDRFSSNKLSCNYAYFKLIFDLGKKYSFPITESEFARLVV